MPSLGNGASPHLENLLELGLSVLGRAGQDSDVLQHLDLAAAVGMPAKDEDLAFQV